MDVSPLPPPAGPVIPRPVLPPIRRWRLVTIAMGIMLGTAGVVTGLWWAGTRGLTGAELVTARFDALKIGLSIGIGSSGLFALYLAWRRQRSTEADLDNRERALVLALAVAADTKDDATEKRITDLYTKAADQLGSDKGPVRLAGLYALERLAQDNETQRQTIVNVLCAYLRMPYTLSASPLCPDADEKLLLTHQTRLQEREVRLTAQRVLRDHLRPGDDPGSPLGTFWPLIDLDLTGAVLRGHANRVGGCPS